MSKQLQLPLFQEPATIPADPKTSRSGSFVDNMALPIHRWFRYSAGFSAQWVEQLLQDWSTDGEQVILDPFAGSGTVALVCERQGVRSIGIEAHPVVARICRAKLAWPTPIEQFEEFAEQLCHQAHQLQGQCTPYPDLIERSFAPELLAYLDALKTAWRTCAESSAASELVWLAITAILRPCAKAGTAQWQYILPNKTKKKVLHPRVAFRQQIDMMIADIQWMQTRTNVSRARLITGDARRCAELVQQKVNTVITSPPYANNYDYADALRFEMTFWNEVSGWSDIHDKVRKYLIVSSSQHASKEKRIYSATCEFDRHFSRSSVSPGDKRNMGVRQAPVKFCAA
jgi:hypothetical protein